MSLFLIAINFKRDDGTETLSISNNQYPTYADAEHFIMENWYGTADDRYTYFVIETVLCKVEE